MESNRLDMEEHLQTVKERYTQVLARIATAARSSGRDPDEVKLVVVTKERSLDEISQVVAAGASCLGENYVDEAISKIQTISQTSSLEWHMIGHVQGRKAKHVCQYFDFVHSLDSIKLAHKLNQFAEGFPRKLPVLLEFNVSGESTKYGWNALVEEQWQSLLHEIEPILSLPNLEVCGLMTMAPLVTVPELARPYFQKLHKLRSFFSSHFPRANWSQLSMGMSADFEVAIQEGATMIRIGTAIFGKAL